MGESTGTYWEKVLFFPEAPTISYFLWVVKHFIAVIYCILRFRLHDNEYAAYRNLSR